MTTHPTADVSSGASIGPGTHIWQQAQVREGATIGARCILGKGVYIDPDVVVGDNCKLENGVSVFRPAVLEEGVFLGPGVLLTNDRVPRAVNPDGSPKGIDDWHAQPVIVRRGAAVGAGSVVLAGVTIGEWALIGAGAVVLHDVPAHAIAVGNPARVVGWVCACGTRLEAEEAAGQHARCERCAAGGGSEAAAGAKGASWTSGARSGSC